MLFYSYCSPPKWSSLTWHLANSARAFVTNQLIWISLNQGANSTRCNSQCVFSPLPTSVQRHREPLICFTNFPFLTFLEKLQGYFLIHPNITSIYRIGIRRFRPLSSSPLRVRPYLILCSPPHFSSSTPSSRVRPYLIPCSPPHFSSSTPSSRVRPLIEWYPDELICDEGTSRMCQMSRWQHCLT